MYNEDGETLERAFLADSARVAEGAHAIARRARTRRG